MQMKQLTKDYSLEYISSSYSSLQYSCLENPRDGGAWWAAVYGVAQSWTRLKRLSSSSNTESIDCFGYSSNPRACISHPSVASLISYISVLPFSEYRSFTLLVRFINEHYILFEAIVN